MSIATRTMVDAPAAIREWVNAQTTDLVGEGKPLPKGAHLTRLHGAHNAAYVYLSIVDAGVAMGIEDDDMRARVSGQVYGQRQEDTTRAAVAYANAIVSMFRDPPVSLPGVGVLLICADALAGPLWVPDGDIPRCLVDADFILRPA